MGAKLMGAMLMGAKLMGAKRMGAKRMGATDTAFSYKSVKFQVLITLYRFQVVRLFCTS